MDIVERLRKTVTTCLNIKYQAQLNKNIEEAADTIEKLRKENAYMRILLRYVILSETEPVSSVEKMKILIEIQDVLKAPKGEDDEV